MIIDTHIHAFPTSDDSFVNLEEIVDKAMEIGLDGICITDHDNMDIKTKAESYSLERGFPIVVGVEILTYEGDILVFGLDRVPDKKLHAQELLDFVNEAGGVAIAAHPFRENNRGLGMYIKDLKGLHGIEAFNGNTKDYNNLYAYALAKELKIPVFGASDAHFKDRVGIFATIFPDDIVNEGSFIEAIKEGKVMPASFDKNGFENIEVFENKRTFVG